MKRRVAKEVAAAVIFIVCMFFLISFLERMLTPQRSSYGSTWGSYLEEDKNSIDVMFFGSSIAYCDIVPAAIWGETGVTSYIMAGPEQTVSISYFYILEALRTQSPEMVFLEATGVFFGRYENFTKANIGYMPRSVNRLRATFRAAEKKEVPGLLFPLYNYHSRWDTITAAEVKKNLRGYQKDMLAGYTYLRDISAMQKVSYRKGASNEENYAEHIMYLEKIARYCAKNGIKLCYYIAPCYLRVNEESIKMLEESVRKMPAAEFIDFNSDSTIFDSIGLDPEKDFYDALHLNFTGAKKFSSTLSTLITERFAVSPGARCDEELWSRRLSRLKDLE